MYLASVIPATGADCSGAAGSGFVNALNLFTGTSPKSGGYFTDQTGLKDKDGNPGVIGSVGISGGMPTEVNVTSSLATVGTGQGPSDLSSGTSSSGINPPTGGRPSRISWREIVAQ
jgi:type IV pilus assembly protein PilY1